VGTEEVPVLLRNRVPEMRRGDGGPIGMKVDEPGEAVEGENLFISKRRRISRWRSTSLRPSSGTSAARNALRSISAANTTTSRISSAERTDSMKNRRSENAFWAASCAAGIPSSGIRKEWS
jgi:hypothetical protein